MAAAAVLSPQVRSGQQQVLCASFDESFDEQTEFAEQRQRRSKCCTTLLAMCVRRHSANLLGAHQW